MIKNNKLLCIDLGSKKSGLSYSDDNRIIAFKWKSIKGDLNTQLKELKQIIQQEKYIDIIFGLPSKKGEWQNTIINFTKKLKSKLKQSNYNITITFQDEDFTSFKAQNIISEIKKTLPKQKRHKLLKSEDDSESARIILQSYLDKNYII